MLLSMTLTPVREDQPRYAVTVSYERRPERTPKRAQSLTNATDFVVAVRRVREWVQDTKGKWHWLVTRVSELRRVPGLRAHGEPIREWPRKMDREAERSEAQRRQAVMASRARAHVNPVLGATEPDWDAALKLRLDAEARERANHESAQKVAA